MNNDTIKAQSEVHDEVEPLKEELKWEDIPRTRKPESNGYRLRHRVTKAEKVINYLISKIASTEDSKHCIKSKLKDISIEYKEVYPAAIINGEGFDDLDMAENEDMTAGLENYKARRCNYNYEVGHIKADYEETMR